MSERYHEAVSYLQNRLWHDLPIMPVERALQTRIRTLLAHFGDPHRTVPVIHVGGSAGKGSTATMIASILRAAGLRTGLYTSPHLQTFIERIDVNGELIAPDRFAELVLGLDPLVRKMHIDVLDGVGFGRPSLVEVAFAVAMHYFGDDEQYCDRAVIEVGLGGRTDCTNVFDGAFVTVLTNVEFEHRERLGPTIADIAREKSAIIQGDEGEGNLVITGARRREALEVITARCREANAELWRLGHEISVTVVRRDEDGTTFNLRTPRMALKELHTPLIGDHQVANAALAVAAATVAAWDAYDLKGNCWTLIENSFGAKQEEAVRRGLDGVRINARLETMQTNPRVILDGAHNPAEARATVQAIRDHWLQPAGQGSQPPPAAESPKLHLVAGILADKDQRPMARAFASIADTVVVTQPPLERRTGTPDRMLAVFRDHLPADAVAYEPSPDRALDLALSRASAEDIVLVTGSMFLAGALRERWCPEQQILERRSSAIEAPTTASGSPSPRRGEGAGG